MFYPLHKSGRTHLRTPLTLFFGVLLAASTLISPLWSLQPLQLPQAQAGHAGMEKLYVGQQGLDSIAVFDADSIAASSTPLTTISLGAGAEPEELVADTVRPYLYASDSAFKLIHVLNTDSDVLEYSIPLSHTPQGLALSGNGNYLYVATDTNVVKIDTRSRTSVATSPTLSPSFTPWDLALSKNEDRLWVTSGALTGQVRSFSPSSLAQIDSITPGTAASGYGIVGDGNDNNRAMYADGLSSVMRTFDDQSNTSATMSSSTGYGLGPWAVEREPRSPKRFLVTGGFVAGPPTGDSVIEFNTSSPFSEVRHLSNLGGNAGADQPSEIAFSSKVDRAFVSLTASDKVSVINLNPSGSMSEAAVVPLTGGANPYGMEIAKSPKALQRFAGANRYDTGVQVSKEAFGDKSVDALVLASLEVFPDSLVAAPLAGLIKGPLLGTTKASLPAETQAEIARVFDNVDDPEEDVWVIGGSAVVSDAVVNAVKAINSKIDVGRIAGSNRYETSHFVAAKMDTIRGTNATGAFLAKGTDFPDALTAGASAANSSVNPFYMPILLTESDALNEHAEMYLQDVAQLNTIYLAGGTAALSAQVASSATAFAGSVTRLGGTNRFDTARIIAANFFPTGPTTAVFALGNKFPDALVAAPFAGIVSLSGLSQTISGPILLVNASSIPSETSSYLSSVGTLQHGYIAGGTAAITSNVESSLNALF
ncbi:MAG: cell wall-binding repeat-containing protein [Candidatus Andersenbacteria bacterium]